MKLTAQYSQDSRTITLYLSEFDASNLADGAVTEVVLADDAVTQAKIADSAVITAHLQDSLVTSAKLASLAVDENKLADLAVTSGKVAQEAITTASDRDGVCQGQTTGGAGNLTINGAYSSAGVATLNPVAKVSVYSAGNLSALTFTVYGTDSLDQAQNEAVTGPNNTTVYTTANFKTITQVAVNGAVATAVEVGAIYSKIDFSAIETAHIKDAAIGSAAIAQAAIGTAHIADANITNAKIDRASANKLQVVTADIADANVTTAKIADANITTAKIADANITTAKIANLAVTNAQINDLNGTKITASTITGDKLAAKTITAASGVIDDLAVGTLQLASQAVTIPVSAFTAGSISVPTTDVTIQQITITSTGAPIFVLFSATCGNYVASITLLRGSTTLTGAVSINGTTASGSITDQPGSGSYTYYLKARATSTTTATDRSLLALEVKK